MVLKFVSIALKIAQFVSWVLFFLNHYMHAQSYNHPVLLIMHEKSQKRIVSVHSFSLHCQNRYCHAPAWQWFWIKPFVTLAMQCKYWYSSNGIFVRSLFPNRNTTPWPTLPLSTLTHAPYYLNLAKMSVVIHSGTLMAVSCQASFVWTQKLFWQFKRFKVAPYWKPSRLTSPLIYT